MTSILASIVLAFALVATASAADLPPRAAPESVGLSSDRLDRITARFSAEVEKGAIPGAAALVYRRGKIAYFETFGVQDPATGAALPEDAIYRIYSMTKPIVSVGVMMLAEEGALQISDPVATWIPELGGLQVAVVAGNPGHDPSNVALVPSSRDMTVQDLLRHTSGITYGVFGDSYVKDRYREAGVASSERTAQEQVRLIGTLPLASHPGTVWEYSRSTDVLGYLIEVVSGMPLDRFLHERVFQPLGMTDTGFFVPADQQHRIVEPQADPATGMKPAYLDVTRKPVYLSGGGGLVSTVSDYLRFARMMLNGGTLDGVRLLSRKTVAFMTSDHLPPGVDTATQPYLPGPGYGFGLGVAVRTAPGLAGWPSSPGEYFWGGYAGTYFWVDPAEELIAVYMMQQTHKRRHYRKVLRHLVSQAIID